MGSGERRCVMLTLFRYLTSVNVTSTILACIWSIRMRHAMLSFLFNNYSNVIKTRYLHENKKTRFKMIHTHSQRTNNRTVLALFLLQCRKPLYKCFIMYYAPY